MYEHQRHKPPRELTRPRELLVVCAPMRSNVNLSRIARAASCCGLERMICTGPAKLERRIAREALAQHRPVRTATVNALRGALQGGAYTVDAAELAQSMLGEDNGRP